MTLENHSALWYAKCAVLWVNDRGVGDGKMGWRLPIGCQ